MNEDLYYILIGRELNHVTFVVKQTEVT